jgi:hypothetical protein
MRRAVLVLCALPLSACVSFTGASDVAYPEGERYAGIVAWRPVATFLGLPGMAVPIPPHFTVADCFEGGWGADLPGLVIGSNPVSRVCRQYRGVDLRETGPETLDCFERAETRFGPQYLQPWLSENDSEPCAALVAEIQRGRK